MSLPGGRLPSGRYPFRPATAVPARLPVAEPAVPGWRTQALAKLPVEPVQVVSPIDPADSARAARSLRNHQAD